MDHEKKELTASVRDLAFLSSQKTGESYIYFKNAEKGREIHQRIQNEKRAQNSQYKTEYYLKYRFKHKDWYITLRGRIDLVVKTSESIQIEEIKSFYLKNFSGSLEDERINPYTQQLQCYAWMYNELKEPDLPLKLILILYNRFDDSEYQLSIPRQKMDDFIFKSIDQLLEQEQTRYTYHQNKVESLKKLTFPFTYRSYQEEIIQGINQTLDDKINLIIEAPSGLGKTVVSLFPLLSRAIRENRKLFFLTAKATQKRIVEETLSLFHHQGVKFLAVVLKAKEKICTNSIYFCHEDHCSYLKNQIKSYPEALLKTFLEKQGVINPEQIEEAALTTMAFCPFEFALDLTLESDIIISDYNYVFHPRVLLQRFFAEYIPKSDQYYLIIDEAHNLVNRSLDYYSHSLSQKDVFQFKQDSKLLKSKYSGIPVPEFLFPLLERIFRILRSNYGISPSTHILESIDVPSFEVILQRLEEQIPDYLRFLFERNLHWPNDPILRFYYHLRDFTETAALAQHAEEFSIIYNSHEGEVKLLCKDASPFLRDKINRFISVLAISATITPFSFYRDLLGFPVEKTIYKRFPSPFPPENRKILVVPTIDTRYKQRHEYYQKIAQLITDTIQIKPGKYFAFFPSFKFASDVLANIKPIAGCLIIKQLGIMHEEEREKFIHEVKSNRFLLAIAVTAGIFAEGIDLPGMLDGVFIVSPSLPAVSFERELIRQYYEERYSNGFAYAYQFLGLTRTFQAAGRLIRTDQDTGVILFIGQRFATPSYATHFPRYYYDTSPRELITSDPLPEIKQFWKGK